MKIAVASDHAGYALKEAVVEALQRHGYEVNDFGTDSEDSVDYPELAEPAAREVAVGNADRAVLVCGSGVGVAIVANKVEGVRAVNAHDSAEAEMSRRHNDTNVLCLSGNRLSAQDAGAIVRAFLGTEFDGGRHERRVQKIHEVETHNGPPSAKS